jgi:hypothetical protein
MSFFVNVGSRRTQLHLALCSTVMLAALACNQDDPSGPTSPLPEAAIPEAEPIGFADEFEQAVPVGPEAEAEVASADIPVVSFSAASVLRTTGIPFGNFHLPTSSYGRTFTGSLAAVVPSTVVSKLQTARSTGARLVISMAGSRYGYTDRGRFNLAKWKTKVARFRGVKLDSYIRDGTLLGHYLVDEPGCTSCWGGRAISATTLEEMARYSKSIWPSLPTTVRAAATLLPARRYRYLDFAWAQWVGPLHIPSFRQTPQQFRDKQVAAAKARGLGLVFGMNLLSGGDGSSRIRVRARRWQMTAAEVKRVGTVLAAAPYACAMLSWQHDARFLARPGMMSSMKAIAAAAKNRPRSSCNK